MAQRKLWLLAWNCAAPLVITQDPKAWTVPASVAVILPTIRQNIPLLTGKNYPIETQCQNPNPSRISAVLDKARTTCAFSLHFCSLVPAGPFPQTLCNSCVFVSSWYLANPLRGRKSWRQTSEAVTSHQGRASLSAFCRT